MTTRNLPRKRSHRPPALPLLWRDPAEFKSPIDWFLSTWPAILITKKVDGNVEVRHIAALLRRGEPVPPDAQAYLADLLEGKARPSGRPKKSAFRKWADQRRTATDLVSTIDGSRQRMQSKGQAAPFKAACTEYANANCISPESAERRYRDAKAVEKRILAERDEMLAQAARISGQTKDEFLSRLNKTLSRFAEK